MIRLGGLAAALFILASCSGTGFRVAGPTSDGAFDFSDASWDDGRAVVAVYEGHVERYGLRRAAIVRDYVVREYLSPDDRTKRDAPTATDLPVLKVNRQLAFATGSYDYDRMASLFFRRSDGALVRGVGTCINACGIVLHRWDRLDEALHVESYWEGEGVRDIAFELPPHVHFRDELPFVAAAWPVGASITVLAPLSAVRSIVDAGRIGSDPTVRVEATGLCVERVGTTTRLRASDGSVAFEVVHDARGFVASWRFGDDEAFRRTAWVRCAYWERTAPRDRVLVEPH